MEDKLGWMGRQLWPNLSQIQVCKLQSSTPPPQGKASLSLSPSRVAFSILLVTSWYSQQSPSGLTGLPHMWASADQVRRMTQLCVLKAPRLGTEWAHQME